MILPEIFHNIFRISYKLHVASDTKVGTPVLFLHGIASDSSTWDYITPLLSESVRSITIDLLGFGKSPKPRRNKYATQDHVAAIVKTITSLGIKEPIAIVGHSMGGLLAIEIAKKYPELVSELFIISTPLYKQEDIINATSRYSSSKQSLYNGLFMAYERIVTNEKMTLKTAQTVMKLLPVNSGFSLTPNTWLPFKNSLSNTIMRQNSMLDILSLQIPITLYYGKLDVLVQHKNYTELISSNKQNMTFKRFNSAHMITKGSAKVIAKDIQAKT